MKRLNNIIISAVIAASGLFSSSAFAGIDYVNYHENFQMQKETKNPSSQEGKLQHTNKYLREQQDKKTTPQNACDSKRSFQKYDRCYWNPNQ